MGKVPHNKAARNNHKKGKLSAKRATLGRFLNRHIDQVPASSLPIPPP